MENISHSISMKSYNGNSLAARTVYDDVFGGPPTFGVPTLSPRVEDYAEIFGSFRATRASSIPILDLPVVDEGDVSFNVGSSRFDYSDVFSGFNGLDFAVSYEELFDQSKGGDDSSEEAWSPAQSESLSDESDLSACSEKNLSLSNGDSYQSFDGVKQFNKSYCKANQRSNEDMSNGATHVTQLHAVPGFSFVVDEISPKLEHESPPLQVTDDLNFSMDFNGRIMEGKQFRKTMSQPASSSFGIQTFGSDLKPLKGYGRTVSGPNGTFLKLSEISLRTEPSQLPPPSRPPPAFAVKDGDSGRQNSKLKASKSFAFERTAGGSYPLVDVEVDASSSAAASAAAMKDAMEKAQAKLKSAKELMERKKEGLQSRMNMGFKNDIKDKEGEAGKIFDGSNSLNDERVQETYDLEYSGMKAFAGEGRQKVMKTAQVVSDSIEEGKYINVAKNTLEEKYGKEYRSSQSSQKTEGTVTWREAVQFYEVVETDKSKKVFEQAKGEKVLVNNTKFRECGQEKKSAMEAFEQQEEGNRKVKTARDACEWKEKEIELKVAEGAHEWDEYKGRSEATKESCRQKEHKNKLKVTQKVCEQEQNEKKLRAGQQCGDIEKMVTEADKYEDCENLLEIQQKENEVDVKKKPKEINKRIKNEKRLKDAHERDESERTLKETVEREKYEKRLTEAIERAENEKRQKEALKHEEKEKQEKEAREREKNEERQKEAGEREQEEKVKLEKEACEREENEKSQQEACGREQEEKVKLQKEVREREENEKRRKEACEREQEEKVKLEKEAREREENEKTQKEARERKENEKRLKEALEQEENVKKQTEAYEREDNKKRLNEAHEREEKEKEKRVREVWEQEENKKRLQEARESEESEKRLKETIKHEEIEKRSEEATDWEKTENRFKYVGKWEVLKGRSNDREQIEMEKNKRKLKLDQEIHLHMDGENSKASDWACKLDNNENLQVTQVASKHNKDSGQLEVTKEALSRQEGGMAWTELKDSEGESEAVGVENVLVKERFNSCGIAQDCTEHEKNKIGTEDAESLHVHDSVKKSAEDGIGIGQTHFERKKKASEMASDPEYPNVLTHERGERGTHFMEVQASFDQKESKNRLMSSQVLREHVESGRKMGAAQSAVLEGTRNAQKVAHKVKTGRRIERKEKNLNQILTAEEREKEERMKRERELEQDCLRKIQEREREMEREREREKDRMAVERTTNEARERAFAEARERAERAAVERATAEFRQRAMAEARERLEKASAEARERSLAEKASMEARLREERAAVERATAEARERAVGKSVIEKAAFEAQEQVERSIADKFSASLRDDGVRQGSSSSVLQDLQFQGVGFSSGLRYSYSSGDGGVEGESAQRCKARLERHQRTAERAAKALAEKNMRDLLAQRELAERNRLAESLDAEVKRWSSGKEGNLRALLSTLQYILGPDCGWQPIPLTEVLTSVAVKKAYRKATLCVHPDKLQQRGASIQQKYISEKVFDLLKEAWNKFNSEER
ncbi:hypothetical protein F0562_003747 [Nyssa sinensis]|uniref:J domain-containing protein n=1 Tax=Nyssa sinensis TaxID=561372 RepID=A0A5J5BWM0_9ASTE|nr:hypothetical protein F0562_003747 [Nyssa sinensis]